MSQTSENSQVPFECYNDKLFTALESKETYEEYVTKHSFDPTENNHKPFFHAIKMKMYDIVVEMLKDSRVDPTVRGYESLKIALKQNAEGNSKMLELLLLDHRVDKNKMIKIWELWERRWPISVHLIEVGTFESIKRLLEDEYITGDTCNKALKRICLSKTPKTDIIKLLLGDKRIDPTVNGNKAIRNAVFTGILSNVASLLEDPRVDPSDCDNEAIRIASEYGYDDIVRVLLHDCRVDPTSRDNECIRVAAYNGHTSVVQVLLNDNRVDPTACGNEAIRKAAKNDHISIVGALLHDPRVDPTVGDHKILRWASANNEALDILRELLNDNRIDPAASDNEAINRAIYSGNIGAVTALIQNPNVYPSVDSIISACAQGYTDIIRELMDNGRINLGLPNIVFDMMNEALVCARYETSIYLAFNPIVRQNLTVEDMRIIEDKVKDILIKFS